jgi:hypothetical protein
MALLSNYACVPQCLLDAPEVPGFRAKEEDVILDIVASHQLSILEYMHVEGRVSFMYRRMTYPPRFHSGTQEHYHT